MSTSKFTERFQELRKESNKTQAAIATDLGLTPQTLSYYANGREPNYGTLIDIANYFNVSTDYLLGVSDAKKLENEDISKKLGLTDESISTIAMLRERCPTLDTSRHDMRTLLDLLNELIPRSLRLLYCLKMVTDPNRGKNDPVNWDEDDKKFLEANRKALGENPNPEDAMFFDPSVSDYDVFMVHLHNSIDSIVQEIREKMIEISVDAKELDDR